VRAVSLLALVCYFAAARASGNLYPFSTYDMYAGRTATSASRIAVRTASGELREVDGFDAWELDGPLSLDTAGCDGEVPYTIDYLDDAAAAFIREHAGHGREPVEVVRHIWRLRPDGNTEEDCVLQRGRAARR
jgi:hypothetical protein